MEIDIRDYLTEEEIKKIVEDEMRSMVRMVMSNYRGINLTQLARAFTKDEVQKTLPNFEELLNNHIKEEIDKLTLADLFVRSIGWRSDGNKLFNKVLAANEELIDKKIKQLFS